MSTGTIENSAQTGAVSRKQTPRWQSIAMWILPLALLGIAAAMRFYGLNLPFDRDGYDEGVYWQSLLAMRDGHTLYQQIFYAQPPFFLLSLFSIFTLLGSTLWAARLGVAFISLFGLLGAFLLGKALAGRTGAILALLLLIADPYFLLESQTIQAESSSIAFSLLAAGLAYLWWEHPEGRRGSVYAAVTGVTLALAILCKLLAAVTLVPIALLMLARLWQIWQKQHGTSLASLRPILLGIAVFVVTTLLVLLPFLSSSHALLDQVIGLHVQSVAGFSRAENTRMIKRIVISVFGLAAAYGGLIAFLRGDWRVIPLGAWLLATLFMLWRLAPLLNHHLVALTPPLLALAVIGVSKKPTQTEYVPREFVALLTKWATPLAIVLILATTAVDIGKDVAYYNTMAANSVNTVNQLQLRVASDLRRAIAPDQEVVTDAQFIAGLADRHTPPALVDTSTVRIQDSSLTLQQLIDATSQPQVHAVLFFSSRFYQAKIAGFHAWVAQHFHLLRTYGPGLELWVR